MGRSAAVHNWLIEHAHFLVAAAGFGWWLMAPLGWLGWVVLLAAVWLSIRPPWRVLDTLARKFTVTLAASYDRNWRLALAYMRPPARDRGLTAMSRATTDVTMPGPMPLAANEVTETMYAIACRDSEQVACLALLWAFTAEFWYPEESLPSTAVCSRTARQATPEIPPAVLRRCPAHPHSISFVFCCG